MKRLHRLGRLAGVIVCAVTTVAVGVATPAEATVADGQVTGFDEITDDWGDEGPLSRSSYSFSGATGMWQRVLYADGAVERDGTTFDQVDMDCSFGPNTEYATRDWQRRHGLAADGIVGRNTLSRADNKLSLDPDGYHVYYNGSAHRIHLGTRARFPNTGWYSIVVPWGQGAVFQAGYYAPPLSKPWLGPACWD